MTASDLFAQRLSQLRLKMDEAAIDIAVITDDDSVYYYSGYYGYLHMDFGRPTILVVAADGDTVLITPAMEKDLAESLAVVDRISLWNDGMGAEWREALPGLLGAKAAIGIEPDLIPPLVRTFIDSIVDAERYRDVAPMVSDMRMIKSEEELQIARHAGEVGIAMMEAGRNAIQEGVAEYEVALAATTAGTHKAAELLRTHYGDTKMSPSIHFMQILASGKEITMTHHRASTKQLKYGEPVFLCFCGMTDFHRFKLGFDRTFWIGEIADRSQEAAYQTAIDSQAAALSVLGPGVLAEDVHGAYAEVIQSAGFDYPFRCGRATGFSFLERPQLVFGDKTVLKPGMVFAVDGSVTVPGKFRAQVGDSFIITEDGYEQITSHPKTIAEVIV
ncbi:MAG TPA: peptidase M24 [Gammaproteobacteria bacterium]|jgi:Xaa-Pro aminopeptidase|nr:peptidase M24 [Acidiferrobacteraceae bacterium]MDP6398262.1 Xaa-Pro peptidase family protein [Arenicellales bacterium]MDP6552099.1 Xaa-Pro peptidase family protein [Arenicellales bacterium]MDP6918045.1 Xaa-Pro peptidase family protein [Arenicellales bacterium]HCX88825.1 peptidase M24 [Gammaproteobacteria bacterium]|tara:strand:- start:345 stop:1508 length:1164 start_codon:yes stop_codon:yes gene_type:complete